MFLHRGMSPRLCSDRSIQVHESRVAVRFRVVEDALDPRALRSDVFMIEVFARRSECGFPCCKGVLDGLRCVFEFGTEDCGFGCLT